MSKQYDVCILGATGAVGEAMLSILEQRKFPVRNLYPLASSRSAGSTVQFNGKDIANPLATILSVAMMMRYTFARVDIAQRIEAAVRRVLQQGMRTSDIYEAGMQKVGTAAMGDAVVKSL